MREGVKESFKNKEYIKDSQVLSIFGYDSPLQECQTGGP